MSYIKDTEKYIKKVINECGYEIDNIVLEPSSRRDLGEFQINVSMSLAKKYSKNPIDIAKEIINKFDERFINVNIAGPGFINVTINDNHLIKNMNESINNFEKFLDKEEPKKIIIDYGGANAAKSLHVGHMRSANIGEALKRLSIRFGDKVIGDAHIGDMGRQSGMIISEIKKRFPNLSYFDKNYKGDYPKYTCTTEQLGIYYPAANLSAKENPDRMEEVRQITAEIDKGNEPYFTLWKDIVEISLKSIKQTYKYLNCNFDLWNGELSSFAYIDETLDVLKPYMYESQGAKVIDVQEENDNKEIPPLIVIKTDGSTIYATRDLATIYERMKKYNPDEIWYIVDQRQHMYFEQVFRASYKSKMVGNDTLLIHYGFGTVNGSDGKPFKTRDGGVLSLDSLIELVRNEIIKKMNNYADETEKQSIADILTVATIKYSDLLPYRTTDYSFDVEKFSSFEGKTGPYILYTMVRIKSILDKLDNQDKNTIHNIYNESDRNIYVKMLELSKVLTKSYNERVTSYMCEYIFDLCSLFNKFYTENNILKEEDKIKQESFIGLLHLVYNNVKEILNILAIDIPDRM